MAGGATSQGAGSAGGTAQNLTQLQQILQRMGGQNQTPGTGAAGAVSNLGNTMMQMGQRPPMPQQPMPQRTPVAQGGPPVAQAAMPQMGMMNGSMGLNPQQMNMMLARQNGLM